MRSQVYGDTKSMWACAKIELKAAIKCLNLLKKKATGTFKLLRSARQGDYIGKARAFKCFDGTKHGKMSSDSIIEFIDTFLEILDQTMYM